MEKITRREFAEASGVEDWRPIAWGACAYFRTDSFARGAQLVARVAEAADAADHHPDVDLRYSGVTFRLFTHSERGLTRKDVELAQEISVIAQELEIEADPSAVQNVQIAVATPDPDRIRDFWQAALGYRVEGERELVDPQGRNPAFWLQRIDKPLSGRMHIDVSVPREVAQERVDAIVAAGGRIADDTHAPRWWTLADADGHKLDIAT